MTRGELICTILRGAWRDSPNSDLSLSVEELDEVTPLLYDSGAAALGWWRLRGTALRDSPSAELMHQAFRLQVLFAKTHETKVQKIFRLFRTAGVEPILLKGWAIGRLYPQFGLRPSGDIDLFVRRDEYPAALEIITSEEARDCWVDLHGRIFELADRDPEVLFRRSEMLPCGDQQVRVLSAEDHFALLAVHLLKHGAWRPLWLCDIAMLLESMTDDFDWELCLGQNKSRANWILAAASLAHSILGARIPNKAITTSAERIPAWVARRVLREWETPFAINQPPMSHRAPMRLYLRRPNGLLRDLVRRWPSPILATVRANGRFNGFPRITYQLGDLAARTVKFLRRLPRRSIV
jgi:hypothetical protein